MMANHIHPELTIPIQSLNLTVKATNTFKTRPVKQAIDDVTAKLMAEMYDKMNHKACSMERFSTRRQNTRTSFVHRSHEA